MISHNLEGPELRGFLREMGVPGLVRGARFVSLVLRAIVDDPWALRELQIALGPFWFDPDHLIDLDPEGLR